MTNTDTIIIGTARQRDDVTYTNRYETASWYEQVRVDALTETPIKLHYGQWITYGGGNGMIVDSHFPNGFAGVYQTNPNDAERIGKDGIAHVVQQRTFGEFDDPRFDFDLNDGWTFECVGEYPDGRPMMRLHYMGDPVNPGGGAWREAYSSEQRATR